MLQLYFKPTSRRLLVTDLTHSPLVKAIVLKQMRFYLQPCKNSDNHLSVHMIIRTKIILSASRTKFQRLMKLEEVYV